ncbi:LAGLIDADG family homing endonuclease [Caldifermentibacillus hisashii]|nr:LAGLIDADG family homing endonuclease [Caldibacillus thermoamylovorans]MCM3797717.1 helix-turn-helix domain-containing protein [Caldibacillus thermoamylovorans]
MSKNRPLKLTELQLKEIQQKSFMKMVDVHLLEEKYNVSYSTANRAAKKLGLYHTKQHIIDIIKRYLNGEKVKDLKEEYKMSQANINALLRRRGISKRYNQYSADFNYFSIINTEEKAYFLGFLFADGNISRNTMKIALSSTDKEILYKLKECMNAEHPVHLIKVKEDHFVGNREVALFEVTSAKLVKDLERFGCVPQKTFIVKYPTTLPLHLQKHFIRGYMDGDGSFSYYVLKNGKEKGQEKYSISICGTKEMLEGIRHYLQDSLNMSIKSKLTQRHPSRGNNNWNLNITGRIQVLKVLDWLYEDATIYLKRKYEKYKNIPRKEHLDLVDLNLVAGSYIKERRLALGLSREQLSIKAGISHNHLFKIENEEVKSVTKGLLEKICNALKIDHSLLIFTLEDYPDSSEAF